MIDWGYILGTLLIRFVGVFMVLIILMLGIKAMSFIINRFFPSRLKEDEPSLAHKDSSYQGEHGQPSADSRREVEESTGQEEYEPEVTAAITIALDRFLSEEVSPAFKASSSEAGHNLGLSPWAMAGRMEQFRRRLL